MIADKGEMIKARNQQADHRGHHPARDFEFSALTSSGDRRRRKAICDSRIIIHTTVAKAREAITRNVLRHDVFR